MSAARMVTWLRWASISGRGVQRNFFSHLAGYVAGQVFVDAILHMKAARVFKLMPKAVPTNSTPSAGCAQEI